VFFLPFATGSRLSVCTLRRTALAAQSRKNGHIVLSLAQRFRAAVGSPSRDHNKPLTRISHYAWTLLGVGGRAALHRLRKTLWRLALVLSAPPRRSARHPSSSEEGSVFNNSPPDSGGWRLGRRGGCTPGIVFPQPVQPRPRPVGRNSP